MKRVAIMWMVVGLGLSAWQSRGQETDSLFFQPDSLSPMPNSVGKGIRPVVQPVAAESFMTARVHFTGDFIRRFTGRTETGSPPLAREGQIRALFDNEDARLSRRPTGEKSRYAELVDEFVGDVCRIQPLPVRADATEQWYAEVRGRATWQHRERDFTLYLKKNRNGTNWAWEIIGAEAAFLTSGVDAPDLTINSRDSLVFIPPNAHELNFMGLARQLRSGIGLGQFVDPAVVHDATLRGLAQCLADGQLRLPTLLTTTIWLTMPPGWLVQLRQFNRETDNSGWLISDLCRLDGTCLPPVLQPFMTNNHSLHKP